MGVTLVKKTKQLRLGLLGIVLFGILRCEMGHHATSAQSQTVLRLSRLVVVGGPFPEIGQRSDDDRLAGIRRFCSCRSTCDDLRNGMRRVTRPL